MNDVQQFIVVIFSFLTIAMIVIGAGYTIDEHDKAKKAEARVPQSVRTMVESIQSLKGVVGINGLTTMIPALCETVLTHYKIEGSADKFDTARYLADLGEVRRLIQEYIDVVSETPLNVTMRDGLLEQAAGKAALLQSRFTDLTMQYLVELPAPQASEHANAADHVVPTTDQCVNAVPERIHRSLIRLNESSQGLSGDNLALVDLIRTKTLEHFIESRTTDEVESAAADLTSLCAIVAPVAETSSHQDRLSGDTTFDDVSMMWQKSANAYLQTLLRGQQLSVEARLVEARELADRLIAKASVDVGRLGFVQGD